jgi:hypothetical protein
MDGLTTRIQDSPLIACTTSLSIAFLGYYFAKIAFSTSSNKHHYPPGPPRQPFIGALRAFPKANFYQRFSKWAESYGNVLINFQMVKLNTDIIIHRRYSLRSTSGDGDSDYQFSRDCSRPTFEETQFDLRTQSRIFHTQYVSRKYGAFHTMSLSGSFIYFQWPFLMIPEY